MSHFYSGKEVSLRVFALSSDLVFTAQARRMMRCTIIKRVRIEAS
jgi:hypothetical protein